MRWFKRWVLRVTGIQAALDKVAEERKAYERRTALMKHAQERYLELVHGAMDIHARGPMKNWGVFVIKGNGRAPDLVKVVDLSHFDHKRLRDMAKDLDRGDPKNPRLWIDAPIGTREFLRHW